MSELKTEEEQIEAFKEWWKKNGTILVIIIAISVGGYFGWQAWQRSQANHLSQASALYQNMIEAAADLSKENNQKTVSFIAKQLTDDYDDTGYAMFGKLFLARLDAQKGNYDTAITDLDEAIKQTKDQSFIAIANLRITKLLIQKQDYKAALARLDKVKSAEFLAQRQELAGDIYLQQGKRDEARVAYQKASEALGANVKHPLLDIKLKDLVKG
ncbi:MULTISPECIES: YfgM family protein [Marinomonas]|uniref:YfgM family protein n=1 Tax=Marinomonas TaxID=28253 RepID=UPI001054367E|nr:tetratricopeptide repeat protein [Marinomonas flavescens]